MVQLRSGWTTQARLQRRLLEVLGAVVPALVREMRHQEVVRLLADLQAGGAEQQA